MKYKIKASLLFEDENFWIMNNEINDMTPSEIQDGIESCRIAMKGDEEELSWGLEVFELLIRKEISILEYHSSFVAEIPTKDILKMLLDYQQALVYFENLNSK